jgi:hypothetical protein
MASHLQGLSFPGFVVSRVCRVQGLSCPGFVVSRVCRVQGLSVYLHLQWLNFGNYLWEKFL